MAAPRFAQTQRYVPRPANSSLAALGLERWLEAAAESALPGVGERARLFAADSRARRLLAGVFGNSPFLAHSAAAEPDILCEILDQGPDGVVARTLADVRARPDRGALFDARGESVLRPSIGGTARPAPPPEEAALMRALRIAKRRVALAVAIGDISGAWELARVMAALSDLADAALGAAAAFLLRQAAASGAFALADGADPARGSGLAILGMGKLGARELNYSSDIDLIVLYDPERVRTDAP
ncbi:MAG: hypothetical protein AAB223_10145, partial [Pseudomonadota bacterium]